MSNYAAAHDMDTGCLGGVNPTAEEVTAMQEGQYILHAHGGELTKVPVEKSRLPHDAVGHSQIEETALGPDGAVYVNQGSIMCKSTDGGRTWTPYQRNWPGGEGTGAFEILSNGTFIAVTGGGNGVWASSDEGRTWQQISQIELPAEYTTGGTYGLFRLRDDTLVLGVNARGYDEEENLVRCGLLAYRSTDQGKSWQGPSKICDWGHEGGIAQMASGKLLAVVRYQLAPEGPSKVVFLADSEDEGRSWQNFRQLTTVVGQCHGKPAALSDGTVVVIHDSRYGPGTEAGRAMVSYDEGETWEDEVYYMYYGQAVSSYPQSVILEDDVILTIAGTSDYEPCKNSWDACIGHSDLTAIRWKPEPKAESN